MIGKWKFYCEENNEKIENFSKSLICFENPHGILFCSKFIKNIWKYAKACNIYLLVQFRIEGSFRNFAKFQGLLIILHFFPFYNAHPSSYSSSTYLVSTDWCLQDPLSSKKVLSLRKMDLEYWGIKTHSKSVFPEWLIRKDCKLRKFYFDVFFKFFLFINTRLIKEW